MIILQSNSIFTILFCDIGFIFQRIGGEHRHIDIPLNVPNGIPIELWHWRCFRQCQQRRMAPDLLLVESLVEVRCLLLFLLLPEMRSY